MLHLLNIRGCTCARHIDTKGVYLYTVVKFEKSDINPEIYLRAAEPIRGLACFT